MTQTTLWKDAKDKRHRSGVLWKLSFVLMVLLYIEVPLPPLPPRAAFPLALIFTMLTGFFFYQATKLPIREALLLANDHSGHLSVTVLCTEMELTVAEAETLLMVMAKRGLVQVDDDALLGEGDIIYKVKGLNLPE
ncbi:MAG: hypothetical protein EP343_27310 [Deltaproteobacteria bacterium]|nr:MAG: hypothetical protein EP343_27310 [Deltaproteobacteria bacterium]